MSLLRLRSHFLPDGYSTQVIGFLLVHVSFALGRAPLRPVTFSSENIKTLPTSVIQFAVNETLTFVTIWFKGFPRTIRQGFKPVHIELIGQLKTLPMFDQITIWMGFKFLQRLGRIALVSIFPCHICSIILFPFIIECLSRFEIFPRPNSVIPIHKLLFGISNITRICFNRNKETSENG
jgi:hypothetical protein